MRKALFGLAVVFFFLGLDARAQVVTFPNLGLDPANMPAVFQTFATATSFRSLEPAGDYGPFGFHVGLIASGTSMSKLSSVVNSTSAFPDGYLGLGLAIPGFGFEVGFLPNLSYQNTSWNFYGGNLKWVMSKTFSIPVIDIALRGNFSSTGLQWNQIAQATNVQVNYNNTNIGAYLMLSKQLLLLEPFVGYGVMTYNSTVKGSATALFNANFGAVTQTTGTGSSGWLLAGMMFRMGFMTITVQYDNEFGLDTYSGRFGFRI